MAEIDPLGKSDFILAQTEQAWEKLNDEIDRFLDSAERDIQLNLFIISLLLVVISTDFFAELRDVTRFLAVLVVVILAISAVGIRYHILRAFYYRGTLPPRVWKEYEDQSLSEWQALLLSELQLSHDLNDEELRRRARWINRARYLQIGAMGVIIIAIGIEVLSSVVG